MNETRNGGEVDTRAAAPGMVLVATHVVTGTADQVPAGWTLLDVLRPGDAIYGRLAPSPEPPGGLREVLVEAGRWIALSREPGADVVAAAIEKALSAAPVTPDEGLLEGASLVLVWPGDAIRSGPGPATLGRNEIAVGGISLREQMERAAQRLTDFAGVPVQISRTPVPPSAEWPGQAAPNAATFWLVERGQERGQVPTVWWDGREWTETAVNALRFESRAVAEAYIDERSGFPIPSHGGPIGSRFGIAVEHGLLPSEVKEDQ